MFVPNATTGVNTVLKSITFSPGDEVVITDHIYNACKNALELVARRWLSCGKRLVRISAQVYNKEQDYLTLAEALREILGHGSGGCGS
ncbi:MAG: hypothetical protein IMF26_01815 [Candidatus Fermentithermobacillus carboniphilus]|uniref:Aminotransferase class V domain-containing protein n=1 Tax=Candidatus Fermentithermobacillus carboniphilus TaxID=3085328 RepID=A0AAT9LCF2_9FIRM|nr:MAG: hypothetical protein IMF26_01815 [Candidatus Fermentithermobacillus carboniphilus]